jgi:hypothetical protein
MSISASQRKHHLTDVDKEELADISAWLQNASFDRRGDFEQCSDNAGLLQHASRFLQILPLSVSRFFQSIKQERD